MESDARQTVLFEHFRKTLTDIVRSDEVSEWIDADHVEVLFGVVPSIESAVFLLHFPVLQQDFFHLREQWKRPFGGFGLHLDRPKPKKYSACYYSPEQVQVLMEAAKGERLYIPVILAAYYGLRRSEAVGLMWSDIDFENKRIYIRNKASEVKKDGRLQTVITDEMVEGIG